MILAKQDDNILARKANFQHLLDYHFTVSKMVRTTAEFIIFQIFLEKELNDFLIEQQEKPIFINFKIILEFHMLIFLQRQKRLL